MFVGSGPYLVTENSPRYIRAFLSWTKYLQTLSNEGPVSPNEKSTLPNLFSETHYQVQFSDSRIV